MAMTPTSPPYPSSHIPSAAPLRLTANGSYVAHSVPTTACAATRHEGEESSRCLCGYLSIDWTGRTDVGA